MKNFKIELINLSSSCYYLFLTRSDDANYVVIYFQFPVELESLGSLIYLHILTVNDKEANEVIFILLKVYTGSCIYLHIKYMSTLSHVNISLQKLHVCSQWASEIHQVDLGHWRYHAYFIQRYNTTRVLSIKNHCILHLLFTLIISI